MPNVINGDNGPNILNDTAGDDQINAMGGDDIVTVTQGADSADGGSGNDSLVVSWGGVTSGVFGDPNGLSFTDDATRRIDYSGFERFVITTGSGNDDIATSAGNDVVSTGEGSDTINTGAGNDQVDGGGGDDVINVVGGNDSADGGSGSDGILADLSAAASAIVWNLQTNSYSGPIGSFTNFEYLASVFLGSGNDTVVTGTAALDDDIQSLGAGDNSATVVDGHDHVAGGADNDTLIIAWGAATSNVVGDPNGLAFTDGGTRRVDYTGIDRFDITTGSGNDDIATSAGNDVVSTGEGNDTINTGAGNDQVDGGGGDDVINVVGGNDSADGGSGNDGILADLTAAASAIVWNLQANSYSGPIGGFTNFEYLASVFLGSGNDTIVTGTGDFDDDIQSLGAGENSATVVDGHDHVAGGADNDTLVIAWGAATSNVVGDPNGLAFTDGGTRRVDYTGIDRFFVTTGTGNDDIALGGAVGNDIVSTGGGNDSVDTGSGDDQADGGSGNDVIDVGTGNDSADGGTGSDAIIADLSAASSAIVWDLLHNSYSGPIGSFTNFESFGGGPTFESVLLGSGNDIAVTGTGAFDDAIDLGAGDDSATIFDGFDKVGGGDGNDLLIINWGASTGAVTGMPGLNLNDGVTRGVDFTDIERFIVTTGSGNDDFGTGSGNDSASLGAGNDSFLGRGGDDSINGGAGDDSMTGGAGNDTYFVDSVGDAVIETAGQGRDKVFALVTGITLAANVDDLTLLGGSAVVTGTGNDLGNVIFGNDAANQLFGLDGADSLNGAAGNDILDGGTGADFMVGGNGDDTFVVDQLGDSTAESASGGTDTVRTALSYSLVANLENLVLIGGAAVNGTGNELANAISGNNAANTLDGSFGADILRGAGGNDIYVVDNAGDQAIEASAAGGTDTVQSSVTFTLGANVENLVLTGNFAIGGNGNGLANDLTGNAQANALDGRAGADTLRGGLGNDTYFVDNGADHVVEAAGEGRDKVYATTSFTLQANVEDLTLQAAGGATGTGNDLANVLTGNNGNNLLRGLNGDDALVGSAGNDTLQGGLGRDTMQGGADADTFWFTTALGATNVDRILDFQVGIDKMILENSVFSGLPAGALAAGAFNTGSAATQADDRIVYNSATGALFFDSDGNGAAAAVQFATIQAGLALSAGDFTVI